MRVAQDKRFHILCDDFLFKIVKINQIVIIFVLHKLIHHQPPPCLRDGRDERIINRLLYNYAVPRFRERRDRDIDSTYHAVCSNESASVRLPVIVL